MNTYEKAISITNLDGTMITASGRKLDLLNPTSEMINIRDIASGLANNSHFAGQTPKFFSIAQHCVMVCDEYAIQNPSAPDKMKLLALLHDAAEAYIGDMIKPIKVFLPQFVELEYKLMTAIGERFRLPIDMLQSIKPYDLWAQNVEFNAFYRGGKIDYLDPQQARRIFLDRFIRYYPGPHEQ